uniref:Lysosomal enzyme trafficking factor n=1 Tax=Naja naja TaxID=35670 RepID=A0A8C6VBC1_NAJNA
MMNFRQRMGWIGVGLYLIASAAAFYYIFEINETYSRLALEHIQQPPEKFKQEISWMHSLKTRLLSVPFWLWAIIFLIPYLQMFLFLYSCTRADPKTVGYCIIPICLAVVCNRHQTFAKASNQISRLHLIDTGIRTEGTGTIRCHKGAERLGLLKKTMTVNSRLKN